MKKNMTGFALLNVLLGVSLLTGIILLIMHAMAGFHSQEKSSSLGEELAPIVDELLAQNYTTDQTYSALCTDNGLLTTVPAAYLNSLKKSGFDVCAGTVEICMGACNAST